MLGKVLPFPCLGCAHLHIFKFQIIMSWGLCLIYIILRGMIVLNGPGPVSCWLKPLPACLSVSGPLGSWPIHYYWNTLQTEELAWTELPGTGDQDLGNSAPCVLPVTKLQEPRVCPLTLGITFAGQNMTC